MVTSEYIRKKMHYELNRDNGLYVKWRSMRARCLYKQLRSYKNYGGRGIKILWNNYKEFKLDMEKSFLAHLSKHGKLNTTLDRINPYGNYCKENCRWATMLEQAGNKRDKKYLNIFLVNKKYRSIFELVDGNRKRYLKVRNRVYKLGWDINKALSKKSFKQQKVNSDRRYFKVNPCWSCNARRGAFHKLTCENTR